MQLAERWRWPRMMLAITAMCVAIRVLGAPAEQAQTPPPPQVFVPIDELTLEGLVDELAITCPEKREYSGCDCRCGNDDTPCGWLAGKLRADAERELRARLRAQRAAVSSPR